MTSTKNTMESVYKLMVEVRKFTRSTLLLQHLIAKSIGLHVTDAECIDFLQEMGPSTAGDLARATGLTTGAITNVIDRLERSGFVKRSPDASDRRKVIVTFIPEKHAKARAHYATLAKEIQQLLATYSEKELSFLIRHTHELAGVYQAQVGKLK